MGMLGRFLSGYSESFLLALVLWPVASLTLTLPILAYLYHRDGRLRFASVVTTYLAVLYVLGLGCFTLYPLPQGPAGPGITYGIPWQLDPLAFVGDFMRDGVATIPQIAFNVALFLPLGFIARRFLRMGFLPCAVLGLLTSFAIEAAQGTGLFGLYPYAYRTADVDDLVYNALGAVTGWLIARASAAIIPEGALAEEGEITHAPGFIRRLVALWLDLVLAGVLTIVVSGVLSDVLQDVPKAGDLFGGAWATGVAVAAFGLVEGVYPWLHGGSTPGGRFVRMSFETCERAGARRAAFYAARLAVLGSVCLLAPSLSLLALLFYLIFRKMPYDFI